MALRHNALGEDAPLLSLVDVGVRELQFKSLCERSAREGRADLRFAVGEDGTALLAKGWSTPEDWGVWSDGPSARLRLPLPGDGREWRLALFGYGLTAGLAPGEGRTITARIGPDTLARWVCTVEAPTIVGELTLQARAGSNGPPWLDFDFPDSVSPAELGCNADQRRLGLALERIILERHP